jgi:hypothetical protein
MRTTWNNIRTWKTARFTVTLDWAWEDSPDLSWDDTGEVIAQLESGELGNYTFRVLVSCDGREIGSDYLGNSIYADPEEFYLEHIGIAAKAREAGQNFGVYFTDMMHGAIAEARKALCNPPRVRCAA